MIESREQTMCVSWFRLQYPEYARLLVANANGGKRNRIEAAIMKGEGVTAGVADLTLYVPSGQYHGLLIEMKSDTGRQTKQQKEWQKLVEAQGYMYALCRGFNEFPAIIRQYFKS